MKDCKRTVLVRFFILVVIIMVVSSCEKNKLNWPQWLSSKKKSAYENTEFDWPRWRGPDGNGISKETGWNPRALENGPKILWRTSVGMGYSNVAIKNNRLYTMGRKSRENAVLCLNAETGKEIWSSSFESNGDPQSTPTIDGEFVYTLSKEGNLLCLKAKDGKVKWKRNIVEEFQVRVPYYGFAGSPVIDGDLIILNANIAGMALNKDTGELVWRSAIPPKEKYHYTGTSTGVEYATPVIYEQVGKRYATVSSYEGLHSVEVKTGKIYWLYDWEEIYNKVGSQVTDPIVVDNKLFIAQYYPDYLGGFLLDISEKEPRVLWENRDLYNQTSSPVMLDGYLYFCMGGIDTGVGSLQCIDFVSGKIVWEERLDGRPISVTAADRKLIILNNKGNLFIAEASPSAYKEISKCVISDQKSFVRWSTYPVLCGGKIYCRSDIGDLVCIDVRK